MNTSVLGTGSGFGAGQATRSEATFWATGDQNFSVLTITITYISITYTGIFVSITQTSKS